MSLRGGPTFHVPPRLSKKGSMFHQVWFAQIEKFWDNITTELLPNFCDIPNEIKPIDIK